MRWELEAVEGGTRLTLQGYENKRAWSASIGDDGGLSMTAVGDGIAIPHPRHPLILDLDRPQVTLGYLASPINFANGEKVHTLFALISPTMRGHLQLLSRLSCALRDPGFRQAVMARAPLDEVVQHAARLEATLAAGAHAEDH